MAEGEPSNIPSPFDVRTIKHLIRLMGRHELTEIDLREGELRIRLRREGRRIVHEAAPTPVFVPTPQAASAPVAAPSQAASAPAEGATKNLLEIKSPTPGTFYAAANPESEPFVRVGSRVQPDTVVCIIEAMKVFNEIQAECAGVIVAIMVENQQPVEYGQVLFKVDPAG